MLHRTSPKRSSEGNSHFSTQFPQVHIVKTPAISVEYPTCTSSFLNSTIFSQNPHVCCGQRQKPGLVHLQNPLVRHTCLGILGSSAEFGGVSWGSTGDLCIYIYIQPKRWDDLLFLSAKMLDIIGSIGGFIWNLLGMFWGLSGNWFGI